MLNKLRIFYTSEDGAVTVDWVVLTSTLLALAIVAGATVKESTTALDQRTGDYISSLSFEPD